MGKAWASLGLGRLGYLSSMGLVACLALLPLAHWIPGGPETTLPPPFWPLYLVWIVGFLVLGLVVWAVVWFLPLEATEGEEAAQKKDWLSGRWIPALLTLVLPTLVYVLVSREVFSGRPLYLDAMTQAFQARVFAGGSLSVPQASLPEFFSSLLTVEWGGRVFSQFPPGWAAILALGFLMGVPWIMAPLFGGLAAYGLFLLLRENGEKGAVALFTTWVFAFSPWIVFNASSWMNHVPVLACILLGTWSLMRGLREPNRKGFAALAGVFLASGLLIRPLEAVAFGIPATLWVLVKGWREPDFRKSALSFAMGGVAVTSLLLLYNWAQHGGPGTFGFELQWGPKHSLGFHEAPWGPPHTFLRGVQILNGYFLALQQVLFEAPLPSLIPALVALLLVKRLQLLDRFLLAGSGLLLLGYLTYFGEGHYLGPRYFLPLAPLVVIWTVRLGEVLAERTGRRKMRPWAYGMVLVLLMGGWLTGAQPRRFVYSMSYPLRRLDLSVLRAQAYQDALVFVPSPWSSKVLARLRSLGMHRQEAQWFHDRIGFCRTEVALADLASRGVRDPQGIARELLPLTADSLAMVRDLDSGIPGDPLTGMAASEEAALELCRLRQSMEETDGGYLLLPFFAAVGPTWTGDGPIVARDLHEENRRLLAEYPEREAYVLRMSGSWGRIRSFQLTPLDPDSVEALWSRFDTLRVEAVSTWRGSGEAGGEEPSILDHVAGEGFPIP